MDPEDAPRKIEPMAAGSNALGLGARFLKNWRRSAAVLGVVAVLLTVALWLDVDQAWRWVDQLGPWGPAAFCGLYAVATVGMVPGSLLTLAAGAKWGPIEGLVWVVAGSNLGANLAFLTGRWVARAWVMKLVRHRPSMAAIDEAVGAGGWKMVMLLRISPVFPFNVLNYALSLTRIRWREYAVATFVGMLPGTALFVYLGSVVQLATRPTGRSPLEWAVFAGGLAATVAVSVMVTRLARGALRKRLPDRDVSGPG